MKTFPRAARKEAGFLWLALAVVLGLLAGSPLFASLPAEPLGLVDLAELREISAREVAAEQPFTLASKPHLSRYGELFSRIPSAPRVRARAPESSLAFGQSLSKNRVWDFSLLGPKSRLGLGQLSPETASGYRLLLPGNRVGPQQKGLWTDPVTGMSYARHRWYDARFGVFLSEDPMGDVDSPTLYQFGMNSPFNYSDPMGLQGTQIGWLYTIKGFENGTPATYSGSTRQALRTRFGLDQHTWAKLMRQKSTQIEVQRVFADLDVQNSPKGNVGSAKGQALLGVEQKLIDRQAKRVEDYNENIRAKGRKRIRVLNEGTAARNPEANIAAQKARVGPGRPLIPKKSGESFIASRLPTFGVALGLGLQVYDAVTYGLDQSKTRHNEAPYVLEDSLGEYVLNRDGILPFYKTYVSGEAEGGSMELSEEEFLERKVEAEVLWGYEAEDGEFVPGLLQRKLCCENCTCT